MPPRYKQTKWNPCSRQQRLLSLCGVSAASSIVDYGWLEVEWEKIVEVRAFRRLLPLVHAAARTPHCPPELREKLHRQNEAARIRTGWIRAGAGRVNAALNGARIETLLLKGIALAPRYDAKGWVRDFCDADIAVRSEEAKRALLCLERLGYRAYADSRLEKGFSRIASHIPFRHALALQCDGWPTIDLHWHLMPQAPRAEWDAELWQRRIHEASGAAVLDPAAALFHAVIHGVADWWGDFHCQWLFDAKLLIDANPEFDWEYLRRLASRRHLSGYWATGCAALQRYFPGTIPAEATFSSPGFWESVDSVIHRLARRYEGKLAPAIFFSEAARLGLHRSPESLYRFAKFFFRVHTARDFLRLPADYLRR